MKEKWKCWYCDTANCSKWKCSKHGSIEENEDLSVRMVKLDLEESRETLIMKKNAAEMEYAHLAMEYEAVWAQLQPCAGLQELARIRSTKLSLLSQPIGIAESTKTQAYLDIILASTQTLLPKFQKLLSSLGQATGVRVICCPIKSMKRVLEKALFYYDKDQSKILDFGRGSAIAEDVNMVLCATQWVINNCSVVRLKNRFCDERSHKGGYRDMLINIHLGGFVFELQIHLKELYAIKAQDIIEPARQVLEPTLYKLALLDKQQADEERMERMQRALLFEDAMLISPPPSPPPCLVEKGPANCPQIAMPAARIAEPCDCGLRNSPEWRALARRELGTEEDRKSQDDGDIVLGRCSDDLSKNVEEALIIYRLGVEKRYSGAQLSLGQCYELGVGVPVDTAEAFRLYKLSAEQNNPIAQSRLGMCFERGVGTAKDECQAAVWYTRAAELGSAEAQYHMGRFYELGLGGVVTNKREAVKYYRMAALQQHPGGQCNLGVCYERGIGLPADPHEAVKWYRLAVVQNCPQAHYYLGCCYRDGVAVPKDEQEATRLLTLSRERNPSSTPI